MKKAFRHIHLWLSVPFGLIITLVCFSGAMLVFEKEVTQWLRPEVFNVDPQGRQPLPMDEVVRRVSATLPEGVQVTGVTAFPDPTKAWQLPLSKPAKASVYANPYTGEVTGRGDRLPFFATMFRLHRWLLDSRPSGDGVFWGKVVVGTSTLLFVLVLVSGIVIWWPRTRKALQNSLKIAVRKGWRRFWYGLHVAGGMYALLLLLVMALTGLTWSFGWYRTGFYALFGRFGNTRGADRYQFDTRTGQLTGYTPYNELDKSGKIRGWIYSMHVGSWGGLLTRLLWFVAALLGATLPLTGYYLWIRRLQKSPSRTSGHRPS